MITISRLIASGMAAVAVVISTWVGVSASFFPISSINFDHGHRVFKNRCASCHSVTAGQGPSLGPPLERVGAEASDRIPGVSAEDYLTQSILEPGAYRHPGQRGVMPADVALGLSPDDVLSLVGYLMSLDGTANPRRLVASTDNIAEPEPPTRAAIAIAEVEAGRMLFLGKGLCIQCHALREVPGFDLRGPSLLAAGRHKPSYLRESICDPAKNTNPGYESYIVHLASGQILSGRLLQQTNDTFTLLVDDGELRIADLRREELEFDEDGRPWIRNSRVSAMPRDFVKLLTESEIEQIVTFLKTLKQ